MSNTQYVFVSRSRMPTRATWQAAIDDLGFDLQLDPQLRVSEDEGFVPCVLGGRDAGFELLREAVETLPPDLRALAGPRDACLLFLWGGDMAACACVLIAACALAAHCDAVVSYEGEPPGALGALLEEARDAVREAGAEG